MAQELKKPKEDPREGGAVAGSAAASCQLAETADVTKCVSYKMTDNSLPPPNLLQESLPWPTLTIHTGKGILGDVLPPPLTQ